MKDSSTSENGKQPGIGVSPISGSTITEKMEALKNSGDSPNLKQSSTLGKKPSPKSLDAPKVEKAVKKGRMNKREALDKNLEIWTAEKRMIIKEGHLAFSVEKGIQANREVYSSIASFGHVAQYFSRPEPSVIEEERYQRSLNISRVRKCARYILEGHKNNSYILPGITVIVQDSDVAERTRRSHFESLQEGTRFGLLYVPLESKIMVLDGQHRVEAIRLALKENSDLSYECIPVFILFDRGVDFSRQAFSDLNSHAVKPPTGLNRAFNSRDPVTQATYAMFEKHKILKEAMELEKNVLPKNSQKLLTFNQVYSGNKILMDAGSEPSEIIDFWAHLLSQMLGWTKALQERGMPEYRMKSLSTTGLVTEAMALCAIENPQAPFGSIDYTRNNKAFDPLFHNGRLVKNRRAIQACAEILNNLMGL